MEARRGRRSRRTNNPVAMRGRILDAAAELFHAKGYHQTTTQEIARSADVSPGAFHHHFPTKKALGLAVIDERVGLVIEDWLAPLRAAPDPSAGVKAAFLAVSDSIKQQGSVRGCLFNNLALELSFADPDFRAPLEALFATWQAAVADQLRRSRSRDWRAGLDVEAAALLIIATYCGAMTMAKTSQSTAPLDVAAEVLVSELGAKT